MTSPEIIRPKAKQRPGDRVFSASALISGSLILAILAAVAGFLMLQGIPGMFADPESVSIYTEGENFVEFVVPLIFGTLWAAALALVMALPLAIGIALFISHYAPRRLAQGLGYIIDLLAAVPSVFFGRWGANVL
ncbi:MAG: phosphate ABC transporter permease subunit PstC, partial [Microcella pacifica]